MPDITISVTDMQASRITAALRSKYAGNDTLMALSDTTLAKAVVKEILRGIVLEQERSQAENKLLNSLDRSF